MEKYIQRTAAAEEEQELLDLVAAGDDTEGWETLIQEISMAADIDVSYDPRRWQPVLERIVHIPQTDKKIMVSRMVHLRRWAAAAAILIVAIGGAFLWQQTHRSLTADSFVTSRNDVSPGGNHAILTLAGGQRILLDSAGIGQLAQQGTASVVKEDSGHLRYQPVGKATGAVLYNTLSTPRGGQFRLDLPDGTHAWLNAASSITYPTVFQGASRKVMVTGEVYLEVTKDKTHPFIVSTGCQEITVLGTRFNIHAYEDETSINTTLLEGSIRVSTCSKSQTLRPGQQAQVARDAQATQNAISVTSDVNVDRIMAWKDGLFNFDGADLPTVLRQLGRWYDIDIVYNGRVPNRRFGGEIPMHLQLSQVLRLLQKMEVSFQIEGRRLIVSP